MFVANAVAIDILFDKKNSERVKCVHTNWWKILHVYIDIVGQWTNVEQTTNMKWLMESIIRDASSSFSMTEPSRAISSTFNSISGVNLKSLRWIAFDVVASKTENRENRENREWKKNNQNEVYAKINLGSKLNVYFMIFADILLTYLTHMRHKTPYFNYTKCLMGLNGVRESPWIVNYKYDITCAKVLWDVNRSHKCILYYQHHLEIQAVACNGTFWTNEVCEWMLDVAYA